MSKKPVEDPYAHLPRRRMFVEDDLVTVPPEKPKRLAAARAALAGVGQDETPKPKKRKTVAKRPKKKPRKAPRKRRTSKPVQAP